MLEFLARLFDTSDFPQRWHCGNWSDGHGWLHILSDLGVWSAYFAIPGLLIYFTRRRKDLPFSGVFLVFAAFILFCGLTHLIEAAIFWWPAYRFAGVMKLATAIVSWATVIALASIIPKAIALRSPAQLEHEVAQRLAELATANEALRREISERQRTEQSLREQRTWFEVTLSSIGDAVIATDAAGQVTFLNPCAERMTGWTHDAAQGQSLSAVFHIVHEQSRAKVENPVDRVLREDAVVGLANHTVLIARDGRETPIDDSAAPIRDEAGTIRGVVLVFHDITDRRESEQKLEQSEERLRLALDAGRMGVWDWDIASNQLEWTGHLEAIHGFAPGEFDGTFPSFVEVVHPDDREFLQTSIRESIEQRSNFAIEFRNLWPDGSLHWVAGKGGAIYDEAGNPTRMVGVGMDISARKHEEQAAQFLAQASATLAQLVDYETALQRIAQLAVPFFADWCVVDMVEADGSLRRLAVTHNDLDKVRFVEKLSQKYPPSRDTPHGSYAVARSGKSEIMEEISDSFIEAIARDAEHLHLLKQMGFKSYMCVPLTSRGKVIGVLSFVAAETGRRYSRSELTLAEDLANRAAVAIENCQLYSSLRESDQRKDAFLAMLAHELRNPLAAIGNGLQLLRRPHLEADVRDEVHTTLARQFEHLARMVEDLLDVSRVMRGKIALRPERVSLAEVVDRAVESARPLIDSQHHTLRIDLPAEPVELLVDPIRLSQVLANLLFNAAKYTDAHGRIEVSAAHKEGQLVVSVRDTGIGIAPEMLQNVFELFTQTDEGLDRAQGGLGIGLTLVKRFVEMHGGQIEAHSDGLGRGSEFIVRLPLQELSPPAIPAIDQQVGGAVRGRNILVVDDNIDAARTLALVLKTRQHQVQIASDGSTALKLAEDMTLETVILDIGMPGMDGYEVAQRLRARPDGRDLVLIALTGWGGPDERRRTAQAGFDHHLVKPVKFEDLERIIADGKPGSAL